jgi:hypothetical protein
MSSIRDRDRDQYRPVEAMSHQEAAEELLGQVVRSERDRANRNRGEFSQEIRMASAQVHALLAVADELAVLDERLKIIAGRA